MSDFDVVEAVRLETLATLMAGVRMGNVLLKVDDAAVCVLATRIAIEALKRHNIFGRPLKVHVHIYNHAGWVWQQAHPDDSLIDALDHVENTFPTMEDAMPFLESMDLVRARVRFCGKATDHPSSFLLSDPGWLNGHCVALLDTDEGKLLLDTTSPQFTTPQFKIFVPPLLFKVEDSWASDPGASWVSFEPEELNGGAIAYRQPRDMAGVYDAPDWKDQDPREIDMLTAAILKGVEARLALARL